MKIRQNPQLEHVTDHLMSFGLDSERYVPSQLDASPGSAGL